MYVKVIRLDFHGFFLYLNLIVMELNKIYKESALDTMARMPDGFIDCVVTSPPFYGLRKYDIPDCVWDGERDCRHEFKLEKKIDKRGKDGTTLGGRDPNQSENRLDYSQGFCQLCNAWKGQLGLEPTFQLYIKHLTDIFREVKRVLKKTGTIWVNLGDSYASSGVGTFNGGSVLLKGRNLDGHKSSKLNKTKQGVPTKSLLNIPARFAIAMTDELGLIQRNEIIWHKKACMPSSAKDRFTVDFEKIMFFTKAKKYYFEQQKETAKRAGDFNNANPSNGQYAVSRIIKVKEQRNMRTTWSINYEPSSANHYASYPTKLVETPILAGCPVGGIVYDPFAGTATTLEVAHKLDRQWIGSDLGYEDISNERMEVLTAQNSLFHIYAD